MLFSLFVLGFSVLRQGGEAAQEERSDDWLRDGQQWPQARPKREALQGRASSELRYSPTRPQGGAAPKKANYG